MSGATEQIIILYNQGNTPDEVADMLGCDVADVLLILQSLGKLTKKNVKKNIQTKVIENAIVTSPEGASSDAVAVIDNDMELEVEDIYKKYQKQVAKNICRLAMSEPDEMVPAGVILKAGIYVQEEATGRNEARAKKSNNPLLVNIAEVVLKMKNSDARVRQILGKDNEAIDVGTKLIAA